MPNRCAIYTRKSSDEGLEQGFNSLDAQREACAAFITSQRHEGWELLPDTYDDGGYSGGTLNRPAIQRLLEDCKKGNVDTIVVYKIDRLTRSLADFAKMVEMFDACRVTFVSVTQQFNTTTSMGRLTLNVLLSFAQFEREVTSERIRDKIAASKAKGMWMGGHVPLGYIKNGRSLAIHPQESETIRHIFQRYTQLHSIQALRDDLAHTGIRSRSSARLGIGYLATLLGNPIYNGHIRHKNQLYPGTHPAIIDDALWATVQTLRETSKHTTRHRTRAKERSLLAGLLTDAEGHPMSASHSNKKGKRYRYYVSQAVLQGRPTQATTLTKIPAPEIESLALAAIPELLEDDAHLTALIPQLTPAHRNNAKAAATAWLNQSPLQHHIGFRTLVPHVTLHPEKVELTLSIAALTQLLGHPVTTADTVLHSIPIKLKRIQGGATYIITSTTPRHTPNPTLIKAIAKAVRWNHLLCTGQATSQESLAQAENIRGTYLRKLMPLALLAPDIIEAILHGEEPQGLTLATLLKVKSTDWPTQRTQLGFTAA